MTSNWGWGGGGGGGGFRAGPAKGQTPPA
eukprot:SAG22_NODE_1740_length_3686_cov_3.741846_1_plen_28_part_10